MEGRLRLLLVAGLLASLLPAVSWPQPEGTCEPALLASKVAVFCADGVPSPECCYSLVAAVDIGGGVPCLCLVAAEPQLVIVGLTATHLLTLYTSCGGLRPGDAHLAGACEGPASPVAADVTSPSPAPAERRKSPAHEAPPPPASTEKPFLPPQQHAGASHSKAIPAYEATSPLAPAAATFGPQPGSSCNHTLLGSQVALFCVPDMPTAQCCEPVVAAVDLGGGVPCLCRVAAEPQLVMAGLNATHLLTLYNSCGGLRPGGAQLAAICEDKTPLPLTEKRSLPPQQHARFRTTDEVTASTEKPPSPPQQHGEFCPIDTQVNAICDLDIPAAQRELLQAVCHESSILARQLMRVCSKTEDLPTKACCNQVIGTVNSGCLCEVCEEPEIMTSILDASHMWYLYNTCGGKHRVPKDTTSCSFDNSPPPPPPHSPSPPYAPTAPSPPNTVSSTLSESILQYIQNLYMSLTVTSICLGAIAVGLALGVTAAAVAMWSKAKNASVAPSSHPAEPKSHPPTASKACHKVPVGSSVAAASAPPLPPAASVPPLPSAASAPPLRPTASKACHNVPVGSSVAARSAPLTDAAPQAYPLPRPPTTPSAPPIEIMEAC